MASACVNNIGVSPETFQPTPTYSSYTCSEAPLPTSDPPETQDTAVAGDFEFRPEEDPITMLPADELFSDGKLVPLHFSVPKQHPPVDVISSPETPKSCRRQEIEITGKAPRSSSRWREILGLKKPSQNSTIQPAPKSNNNPKSLKHFLNRTSKSSSPSSSLNLPLLKDTENYESVPVSSSSSSSRLSLSSSSSSHEHEDLPRLSLDSDKPSPNPFAPCRTRTVKPEPSSGNRNSDSPRMNSSGKIMFQSLERSSSSPSSFNGGPPKFKNRGMERSYSANVRVTPVLNVVPLSKSSSVFGFFTSSSSPNIANGGSSTSSKGYNNLSRSKTTDRNH